MSPGNLEFVEGVYAEWAKGNFVAGTDAYDPNVALILRPDFPDAGVYTGLDGVRRFMRTFLDPWETVSLESEDLRENGDTILARVVQRGVGRLSGAHGDLRYFHVWTFRAGKVIRLEVILDEAEALAAAGLSP